MEAPPTVTETEVRNTPLLLSEDNVEGCIDQEMRSYETKYKRLMPYFRPHELGDNVFHILCLLATFSLPKGEHVLLEFCEQRLLDIRSTLDQCLEDMEGYRKKVYTVAPSCGKTSSQPERNDDDDDVY